MTIRFEILKEVLTKKAYNELMDFMIGQTVCEDGIYEDDFLRWINKLGVVD